jgi:hypothetical protein
MKTTIKGSFLLRLLVAFAIGVLGSFTSAKGLLELCVLFYLIERRYI